MSIIIMDSSFFLRTCPAAICFFTLLATIFSLVYGRLRLRENKEKMAPSLSPPSSLPTSSPPSSLSCFCTHQVFPSFCGEDVRRDFLSHIQKEFQKKGITSFIDNEIKRGESIGPELIRAIRGSKIAIVLLSRNYGSSSWCLDELVEIMKGREELGQTVKVIFYKVDPTDVKKQTGDFGKVFRKTCSRKTKEDTERWRQALAKVATIAGYHSNKWENEATMIEKIATDILNKLNTSTPSNDFDGFVGMVSHMRNMEQLLCLDLDEVMMIGIWGMSGIGKTTIARVLFNQHSQSFDLSVFIENIKALTYTRPVCSDDYGLKLQLQQQLMSQIINQKDIEIPHLGVVQERLKDKRVLVVLDDVDQSVQLDAMAKETWWFGRGSRIIITTQDRRILGAHGIENIYNVYIPETNEALQIFCMNAFGQKSPKDGFEKLAREVTSLAGKLPLGLRVMGSYFREMSKHEWENALPRLKTCLDGEIKSILKLSYDALSDKDKDLFLHIACFFNGECSRRVLKEALAKNFSDASQGIHVLVDKSLVYIDNWGQIRMHNLLEQLGREIVHKQSINDPGQRQFLVDAKEICQVLTDDTGSRSILGLDLNLSEIENEEEDELNISDIAIKGMSNLQFLRVHGYGCNNKLHLPRGLTYLSKKLRVLHWDSYPLTCLPLNFHTKFLVKLVMRHSKLEKLWEGIQPLRNLKWMTLSHSKNLKEVPDLSTATNLQLLSLRGCSRLVELPSSFGNATKLEKLYLNGCSSLVKLPSSIGNLDNLWLLELNQCSSLVELPSSIWNATNLNYLTLVECSSLVQLPSSIENATNLRTLHIVNCSSLVELPSTIGNLHKLNLVVRNCSKLVALPINNKEISIADLVAVFVYHYFPCNFHKH